MRGKYPELEISLHVLGFLGNLAVLILLVVGFVLEPTLDLSILVVPVFIATTLNFENIGSFLAYNRVARNN